jgi:sarcosine oxidase subunit gamma
MLMCLGLARPSTLSRLFSSILRESACVPEAMIHPVSRHSALVPNVPVATFADLTVEQTGPAARFVLRGRQPIAQAAGAALQLELASTVGRAMERDGIAALCLGPDEWLLLGPPEQERELQQRLNAALQSVSHSLVSIGHRDVAFVLRGNAAADVINAGCPLDLRMAAFPAGCATRTLLGKAEIVLWRIEPQAFRIETARSLAAYVNEFLLLAARDNA